jgi:septum formation inhibitor MinC
MRDIRGDLQDRANLIAEQISATQGQFDLHIEKLKNEHQTILEDLKSALHNVRMVIGIEGRRLGSVPATKAESQANRPRQHHPQQVQSQQPPSDALARKVASVGFR